jgi:WD40 repeat protein
MIVLAALVTMAGAQTAPPAAPTFTVKRVRELQGIRPLAYAPSPTGSQIAVTLEDKSIRIIDAKTFQTVRTFQGHPQPAYAVAWSDDGSFIASGDESARIFIWDARTGKQIKLIYGDHQRGIQRLSFNHPRTLLMSTGKDDKILIWSVPGYKKVGEVLGKGCNFYGGTFNPLTDAFVAATLTTSARMYRQTSAGSKVLSFFSSDPQGQLDVCWNKQGSMILTGEKSGNAVLFDVKGLKKFGTLKGHMDFVTSVAFAPSGKIAATASPDRTVRLWDPKSLKQVAALEEQSGIGSPLAFTADGKYMATVGINDFMQIYTLTPPQSVNAAAATPVKKPAKKG